MRSHIPTPSGARRSRSFTAMVAASALVLGACDEQGVWTEPTGPVVDVVVATIPLNEELEELTTGTTVQLIAGPVNEDGLYVSGQTVTWSSSNDAVVEVSSTGLATARSGGTAVITASAGGASGTTEIAVRFPVGQVSVSPTGETIRREGAVQLTATVVDQGGTERTNRPVTWTSSNPAVATVSSTGLVSGVTDGSVTITATSEGVAGTATVTVFGAPVIATVTVTPASPLRGTGQTQQMTATARAGSGTVIGDATFTWESSNTAVATVSPTGLVSFLTAGTATISATAPEITGPVTGSTASTVLQRLVNGQITNVPDVGENTVHWYMMTVPGGLASFTVQIFAGTSGDADIYVYTPQNALPTGHGSGGGSTPTYTCRPWNVGSNEICTLNSPAAGDYLVGIHAYPGDGNVSGLTIRFSHP